MSGIEGSAQVSQPISDITPETCPERQYHGKPFRYCGVKGCGWVEVAKTNITPALVEEVAAKADRIIDSYKDQVDRQKAAIDRLQVLLEQSDLHISVLTQERDNLILEVEACRVRLAEQGVETHRE